MSDEKTPDETTTSSDPNDAVVERDKAHAVAPGLTNPENAPADGSEADQRDSAGTEDDGGTHA